MVAADDPATYVTNLAAMTDEEVFNEMKMLEDKSEVTAKSDRAKLEEVLSQIGLVEEEIEQRFPGQALAPYKQWLRGQ